MNAFEAYHGLAAMVLTGRFLDFVLRASFEVTGKRPDRETTLEMTEKAHPE